MSERSEKRREGGKDCKAWAFLGYRLYHYGREKNNKAYYLPAVLCTSGA